MREKGGEQQIRKYYLAGRSLDKEGEDSDTLFEKEKK